MPLWNVTFLSCSLLGNKFLSCDPGGPCSKITAQISSGDFRGVLFGGRGFTKRKGWSGDGVINHRISTGFAIVYPEFLSCRTRPNPLSSSCDILKNVSHPNVMYWIGCLNRGFLFAYGASIFLRRTSGKRM